MSHGITEWEAKDAETADTFYYARDHVRGAGAWCVRGPGGFQVEVGDKMAALILAKLMSGKTEEAASAARDYVKLVDFARGGK